MNADALLEGEFIKAVELGDKLPANPTYTIVAVNIETMPNIKKPGKEINKGVIMFAEIPRGWVMNRTNVECLKALFGPDTDGWLKHRVTLGTEPTKTGLGIRIVGSPDINEPVTATWTPPRQRAVSKKMVPTGERKQQQTAPVDKDLQAFRHAIGEAMKRAENPWTQQQIVVALESVGAKNAAEVPADKRARVLDMLRGAPPADAPPSVDSAITAALNRGAASRAIEDILGDRDPKTIPADEAADVVAKIAAL
jgi:hypothetical protein